MGPETLASITLGFIANGVYTGLSAMDAVPLYGPTCQVGAPVSVRVLHCFSLMRSVELPLTRAILAVLLPRQAIPYPSPCVPLRYWLGDGADCPAPILRRSYGALRRLRRPFSGRRPPCFPITLPTCSPALRYAGLRCPDRLLLTTPRLPAFLHFVAGLCVWLAFACYACLPR